MCSMLAIRISDRDQTHFKLKGVWWPVLSGAQWDLEVYISEYFKTDGDSMLEDKLPLLQWIYLLFVYICYFQQFSHSPSNLCY